MIVDANVLLYAVDSSSPFHRSVKDWLESSLNEPSVSPLSPSQAWSLVADWLEADATWVPVSEVPADQLGEPAALAGGELGPLLTGDCSP